MRSKPLCGSSLCIPPEHSTFVVHFLSLSLSLSLSLLLSLSSNHAPETSSLMLSQQRFTRSEMISPSPPLISVSPCTSCLNTPPLPRSLSPSLPPLPLSDHSPSPSLVTMRPITLPLMLPRQGFSKSEPDLSLPFCLSLSLSHSLLQGSVRTKLLVEVGASNLTLILSLSLSPHHWCNIPPRKEGSIHMKPPVEVDVGALSPSFSLYHTLLVSLPLPLTRCPLH